MNLFVLLGVVGPWQAVIIIVAFLLLFGGKKIPELMKGLGQGMKEFKKASSDLASELKNEDEKTGGEKGRPTKNRKSMMEFLNYLLDFFLHLDVHLADLIAQYGIWVYAILFLIIFCETGLVVTPFLPGDSLLFMAGALTALPSNGLNVVVLVLLLIVAAVLGDGVNYAIGRFFGGKLFSNPDSKIFRRSYLDKTHAFYEKHGGKTIILARFIPIVRTFAPFVAGMGKMNYRQFGAYNIIGGVAWTIVFTFAGYFFGGLSFVQKNIEVLALAIIFLSVLPAVFEVWRGRRKSAVKEVCVRADD